MPSSGRGGGHRGRTGRLYRSTDNFVEDDRDMHVVVRGGVYEVDLGEWKCHSIYWPGQFWSQIGRSLLCSVVNAQVRYIVSTYGTTIDIPVQ